MNYTTRPGNQYRSEFTSETPHFFKIILDDSDIKKLRIPTKFVRKYGSEISCSVSLKVPSGDFWKVELKKCDDGIWLNNGWSEFAKHYSLSYGSFLVFRYEGNCNFHVIIFDKSTTEISYQYSKVRNAMEETEDEVSIEVLNEIQPSKKTRIRSPSPSSQRRKKMKSSSDIIVRHSLIKSSAVKNEIPDRKQFNDKRSGKWPQQTKASGIKEALKVKEPMDALLLARSFQSKNPFFIIRMQPSYIYDKLCVPVKFCQKYLPNKTVDIILSAHHRQARSVGLSFSTRPKLYRGWKAFVKENHLEVGNICVFELINQTTLTFNVVIFQGAKTGLIPGKDGAEKSGIISTISPKCRILDVPHNKKALRPRKTAASVAQGFTPFKSENPFFQFTANPSCNQYMGMPYFFVKEHIKREVINLTVENGGILWPVKVLLYPAKKAAYLGCGWPAFVRENSVKAGDLCAFELINKENSLLRVHFLSRSVK